MGYKGFVRCTVQWRLVMRMEKVIWLWDYVNDKPRLKTEMTKDEIMASEKAKWMSIGDKLGVKKD